MRPSLRAMILAVILVISFSGAALPQSEVSELENLLRHADEIDIRFQEVARSIPLFDQQQATAYVEETARRYQISGLEVKAAGSKRLTDDRAELTSVELHLVEISGIAELDEISRLLRELKLRPVLSSLESVRIRAGSSSGSTFTARVAVASIAEDGTDEISPEDGVEDALRRKLQRDRAKLDAVLRYIEQIETDRRLESLTRFADGISNDHVALTEVLLREGDRIDLSGIAMGQRALAGLEKHLDHAGFIGRTKDLSGEKGCTTFRISATVRPGPAEEVFFAGRDPFGGGAENRCSVRPEPPIDSIRVGGEGAAIISLRRVDLVDLFFVLHDLLAMKFVIDEKVIGSVDLDVFSDAGTEDLLPALRRATHIGEGPLHRVSVSSISGSAAASGAGEPVNLSFRRASVRDLLCVAQSIAERELRMPKGSAARVSIFGEDLPLDDVVSALTSVAGFPPQTALAGPSGEPVCGPRDGSVETSMRIDPHAMRLEDFGVTDLELAGLAILGSVRHAYVYTPGRVLRRIEAEQEIFEGRVVEVTPSGVRVATSSGEVTLRFSGGR